MRTALFSIVSCLSILEALPASARDFPPGSCGVVIASEPTPEALLERRLLSALERPFWVVQSPNGAFAAIVGITSRNGSEAVVADAIAREGLPADSFCMSAENMVFIPAMSDTQGFYVYESISPGRARPGSLQSSHSPPGPTNLHSDVNIAGLDWTMTPPQMERELLSQGLTCALSDDDPHEVKCQGDRGSVSFSPEKITFDCRFISACGLSNEEIADILMETFPVPEMIPLNHWQLGHIGYCGTSYGGNKLCVVSAFLSTGVILEAFGPSARVNFD